MSNFVSGFRPFFGTTAQSLTTSPFLSLDPQSNPPSADDLHLLILLNLPSPHQFLLQIRQDNNKFPNKDGIPHIWQVVWCIRYTCYLCSDCHTRETKRHLFARKEEHQRVKPIPSEISLHKHNYREARIYSKLEVNNRMNKYRPPFELKFFHSPHLPSLSFCMCPFLLKSCSFFSFSFCHLVLLKLLHVLVFLYIAYKE